MIIEIVKARRQLPPRPVVVFGGAVENVADTHGDISRSDLSLHLFEFLFQMRQTGLDRFLPIKTISHQSVEKFLVRYPAVPRYLLQRREAAHIDMNRYLQTFLLRQCGMDLLRTSLINLEIFYAWLSHRKASEIFAIPQPQEYESSVLTS
jgi:hypothetical protein